MSLQQYYDLHEVHGEGGVLKFQLKSLHCMDAAAGLAWLVYLQQAQGAPGDHHAYTNKAAASQQGDLV